MQRESWMTFADVTLRGRAGRDVEVKHTPSGAMIAQTTVAIRRGKKGAEKTLWLPIKGFNDGARSMQGIRKGQLVTLTGTLDVNQWTDRETGAARERIEVLVDSVDFNAPTDSVDFDDVP